MKKMMIGLALAAAMSLTGCFTISETDFPAVQMSGTQANIKVQLEGFLATVVDYTPIYTTDSYLVSGGGWGRRRHYGSYYTTRTSTTYVPNVHNTDVFLQRAQSNFESAGFILRAAPADYTVSATFAGPAAHTDSGWHFLETLASATLLFRAGSVSTANLKIYDNRTGKCIFTQSYVQEYDAHGWSPLPLFGMMSYDKIMSSYQRNWCLDALTDRITADATAFLAKLAPPAK